MRCRLEWEWEKLDDSTQRAKVFGGWLILRLGATDIEKGKRVQFRESMVFLPDRDHQWAILPPISETPEAKKASIAKGF